MTTVETYFKPKSLAPGRIACNFLKPAILSGRKWDVIQHALESEKPTVVIRQDKASIVVIKTRQRLNPHIQEHDAIGIHFKTPDAIRVVLVFEGDKEDDLLRTLTEAGGASGWRSLDVEE
jgi:hypothetical protein